MNADKMQRIATLRDAGLCFSCEQAGIICPTTKRAQSSVTTMRGYYSSCNVTEQCALLAFDELQTFHTRTPPNTSIRQIGKRVPLRYMSGSVASTCTA